MTQRIENYLTKLENELINGEWKLVEFAPNWVESFTSEAGVYAVREEGELCYVEESGSICKRMKDLLDTRKHSLRRMVGSTKFAGQTGYEKATASQKFPPEFEEELNRIFEDNFEVSVLAVPIGRKELEERLIEKYKPKYNLSEKGKSEAPEKAYSVAALRENHGNAYKPWTVEEDQELESLERQGKSIRELATIFGRNRGAISSRLKKIHEKMSRPEIALQK